MRTLAVTVLVVLATATVARAQDDEGRDAPDAASSADEAAEDGTAEDEIEAADPAPEDDAPITAHRMPRDYDGRDDAPPDAGEIALWAPRIVFFPVTLLLDYGIRRPVGALVSLAEREHWVRSVMDAFTWNRRHSGIVPTIYAGWGVQPTVGAYLFSNDDVAPGHEIRGTIAFGGVDTLYGGASYAIVSGTGFRASLRASGGQRPDRVFSGIGWDAIAHRYRYREAWYAGEIRLRADDFWRQSRIRVGAGVDGHAYDPDGYADLSGSQPLSDALENGVLERPPGLDEGFVAARQWVEVAIDTREDEPAPGHGVRVEAEGELVFDLVDPEARRWVRYGGGVGAFLDLGAHRVLGLWGIVAFSDPLGPGEVPFAELVALGEHELLMRGFLRGQLRGRSGAATTLEYRYPIWTHLDARLHASIGNAFDAHLSDFALERLRLSFGLGIATPGHPDGALQFTVAFGTAPFVQGTSIDSVQLVIGSRHGF